MKKIFALLFIITIAITSIQAQNKSAERKRMNWGLKTGFNISTLQMDDIDNSDKTNWKAGFVVGTFFRIKAGNNFMIQPELLYSSMGAKIESTSINNTSNRLNYFSIPVLANYHFSKKWNAVLGPQVDFLIISKNVTGSQETQNIYENATSINFTGGIEFWPIEKFGFNVRYIHGLTNISESNGSIKNQAFQFSFAIRL